MVQNSQLLKSYYEAGSYSLEHIKQVETAYFYATPAPEIAPEDYYDPTDKGLTKLPDQKANCRRDKKQTPGRRARRNG